MYCWDFALTILHFSWKDIQKEHIYTHITYLYLKLLVYMYRLFFIYNNQYFFWYIKHLSTYSFKDELVCHPLIHLLTLLRWFWAPCRIRSSWLQRTFETFSSGLARRNHTDDVLGNADLQSCFFVCFRGRSINYSFWLVSIRSTIQYYILPSFWSREFELSSRWLTGVREMSKIAANFEAE